MHKPLVANRLVYSGWRFYCRAKATSSTYCCCKQTYVALPATYPKAALISLQLTPRPQLSRSNWFEAGVSRLVFMPYVISFINSMRWNSWTWRPMLLSKQTVGILLSDSSHAKYVFRHKCNIPGSLLLFIFKSVCYRHRICTVHKIFHYMEFTILHMCRPGLDFVLRIIHSGADLLVSCSIRKKKIVGVNWGKFIKSARLWTNLSHFELY